MHRRDLLLLRTASGRSIAELSCERLYMQFMDAALPTVSAPAPVTGLESGEPDPVFDSRTTSTLFDDLAAALSRADTVRVTDRSWLADAAFNQRVERLLNTIRSRGKRVEFE